MTTRMHVLLTLADAQKEGNEAVITACEVALRNMPDFKERCALHIELSQKEEIDA
jgi:hypothetical protein